MADAPPEKDLSYKARTYALVPAAADRILDVGCGTGDDALAIAEEARVAETYVVGIDTNLAFIEEAQRRARHTAVNVRFAVGDARALPFADDSFAVVRADGLLQATDDALRVVREMARVTRPGGWVLLHDREDVLAPEGSLGPDASRGASAVALLERLGLEAIEVVDTWPWDAPPSRLRGMSIVARRPALGAAS